MKTMKADEFYKRFVDKVRENARYEDKLLFDVYTSDMKAYIKAVNKKFVPQILTELNLSVENEYFKIDTIGWMPPEFEDEDISRKAHELKLNTYLDDLMVAVEHEMDKSCWIYKLVKLAHIRCPLKVIVAYAPCDKRDEDIKKVEFAYECLTKMNVFLPDSDEEFLVILGNAVSDECSSFDFRGYLLGKTIRTL